MKFLRMMKPELVLKILGGIGLIGSWIISIFETKIKQKEDEEFANRIADTVIDKLSANN